MSLGGNYPLELLKIRSKPGFWNMLHSALTKSPLLRIMGFGVKTLPMDAISMTGHSQFSTCTSVSTTIPSGKGRKGKTVSIIDPCQFNFFTRGLFLQDMALLLIPLLQEMFDMGPETTVADLVERITDGSCSRVGPLSFSELFLPDDGGVSARVKVTPLGEMYYSLAAMFTYLDVNLVYETRSPDNFFGLPGYRFRLWRIGLNPVPRAYYDPDADQSAQPHMYNTVTMSRGKELAQNLVGAIFKGRKNVGKSLPTTEGRPGTEFLAYSHSACIPVPMSGDLNASTPLQGVIYRAMVGDNNSAPQFSSQLRIGSERRQRNPVGGPSSCLFLRNGWGAGEIGFSDSSCRFKPGSQGLNPYGLECLLCADLGFFSGMGCARSEMIISPQQGVSGLGFPANHSLKIIKQVAPLTKSTLPNTPLTCASCGYYIYSSEVKVLSNPSPFVYYGFYPTHRRHFYGSVYAPVWGGFGEKLRQATFADIYFRCPSCQGKNNHDHHHLGRPGMGSASVNNTPAGSASNCTLCTRQGGGNEERYLILSPAGGAAGQYHLLNCICRACFYGNLISDPGILSRYRIIYGSASSLEGIMTLFHQGVSERDLREITSWGTLSDGQEPSHSLSRCTSRVEI